LFCELTELLGFKGDGGLSFKQSDIDGTPVTKEVVLHFLCRDENLIRFITDEYFAPLLTRASFHSPKVIESSDSQVIEGGDESNVRIRIVCHRTGPLQTKDVRESVLWKSFVEKDPEGPTLVDHSQLGTYGTPWLPARFSFGRNETSLGSLPAIVLFGSIFWFSYWFSWNVNCWLRLNPWDINGSVKNVFFVWGLVPVVLVSFAFAYAGHIVYDWYDNVQASKENETKRAEVEGDWNYNYHKVESYLGSTKTPQTISSLSSLAATEEEANAYSWAASEYNTIMNEKIKSPLDRDRLDKLKSLNIEWDAEDPEASNGDADDEVPEQSIPPSHPLPASQFLSMVSKSGRPSGEDLLFDDDSLNLGPDSSTGIFVCGPEKMISSVKSATGLRCSVAAERLQNLAKGNKFVFYEEKFEW